MAMKAFFSFHFEKDIWRASQVRDCWATESDRETKGFCDSAAWEDVKKKGIDAIHEWIDKELEGTSVTVVLIGHETTAQEHVMYALKKSYELGNGLLGIYIHNMPDRYGLRGVKGKNPLDKLVRTGTNQRLSQIFPAYDWQYDNGRSTIDVWMKEAAQKAGR